MLYIIDLLLWMVCCLILTIALEYGGMKSGSVPAVAMMIIVPAYDKWSRFIRSK